MARRLRVLWGRMSGVSILILTLNEETRLLTDTGCRRRARPAAEIGAGARVTGNEAAHAAVTRPTSPCRDPRRETALRVHPMPRSLLRAHRAAPRARPTVRGRG